MTSKSARTKLLTAAMDSFLGLPHRAIPFQVRRDLAVPMPDGVTLLGDLYRPSEAEGPLPTVLIRLPYGRAGIGEHVAITPLARNGFQVFVQSTRGTFGSGGQFRPFTTEKEDGLATVAWMREQWWSDGRIAMTGDSYYGHTQWAIAPYVDPPLEAVSPHITSSRITAGFYDHGAPCLQTALEYTAILAHQESAGPLKNLIPNPRRTARIRSAARRLPLQAVDSSVTGGPVPFWRDFVDHAAPNDPFWSVADHSGADYGRMPPTNMVTGWWDLFLKEQLEDFRRLQEAGVPARLVVGPWLHASPGKLRESVRNDITWLDHHLHGAPAPAGAPVRLFLQQADMWLETDSWPPRNNQQFRVDLLAGGGLADPALDQTGADAGASPRADDVGTNSFVAEPSRFTYDPADPTPTVGGPVFQPPGMQADNRAIERRSDVLCFTGRPLAADLDIVGSARARVFVRTSLDHADVFVRVCDVDPRRVSRNVVDGIRRLHPQTVPAADVIPLGDGVLAVDVALTPTAYRLRVGHRLRVQVSGGAFPRYARNLGTDEPFGSATHQQRCDFEVFHDGARPSHVALSVMPGR